jgi:integrase
MRSTYATIGLMAGANPAYIAGQLGHGVDVFFKDYAAWINGKHNATELDKIEAQIQGNIPKLSPTNIKQA